MEYLSVQYFPGALSDCAAAVLQAVSRAGVWMVAPRDLNYDQLKALLLLRNSGYVEYASFGGYRVRANQFTIASQKDAPQTPAAAIAAILRDAGIEPVRPIMECKDARRRSKDGQSWLVVLPTGARIPADVWARFEKGAYRDGNILIVELKGI